MRASAPLNRRSDARGASVQVDRGASRRRSQRRACSPSGRSTPGSQVGPLCSPSDSNQVGGVRFRGPAHR
eukprot:8386075-Alexandrium_andersonii.AAC.1